jgi:hypothetical protein
MMITWGITKKQVWKMNAGEHQPELRPKNLVPFLSLTSHFIDRVGHCFQSQSPEFPKDEIEKGSWGSGPSLLSD